MPFNGTGIFQRLYNWTTDQANGILVRNDRMDADSDDIALGLSNCITRDGQSPATAAISLGGNKITGLAAGAVATDAVNYGQVFVAPSFTGGVTYAGGLTGTGGATITGVINFAGATSVSVPTAAAGDNSTKAASTAFAVQLAFATVLPAQSLGFLRSSGAAAGFTTTHTGYAQKEVKGADIACAATIDLTAATGNLVHITGSTGPVTAITITSGAEYTLVWDGTPTIVNSGSLILPAASNRTVTAGDVWKIRGDGAAARVVGIQKSDGTAVKAGLTLLATLIPTAAANVDFLSVFTAAYDNYVILGCGITTAADDALKMRFAVAGTADAGSNYQNIGIYSTAPSGTLTTSFNLHGYNVLSTGKGISFEVRIKNANDATRLRAITAEAGLQDSATPTYFSALQTGVYVAANTVSGVRFTWSAGGNFGATGSIRVYGYNNS